MNIATSRRYPSYLGSTHALRAALVLPIPTIFISQVAQG